MQNLDDFLLVEKPEECEWALSASLTHGVKRCEAEKGSEGRDRLPISPDVLWKIKASRGRANWRGGASGPRPPPKHTGRGPVATSEVGEQQW